MYKDYCRLPDERKSGLSVRNAERRSMTSPERGGKAHSEHDFVNLGARIRMRCVEC